jgi:hypothetical protein
VPAVKKKAFRFGAAKVHIKNMIKYSYFENQLSQLKKAYKPENVYVGKNNAAVLVRNFRPPGYFKTKATSVLLEIPPGFGYGINIPNSFILLKKGFSKFHLYPISTVRNEVKKLFNINISERIYKENTWFWMCFHMWGDRLYDINTGKKTSKEVMNAEKAMVGFLEYLNMVKAVLEAIARGDVIILDGLKDMNENREKILKQREQLIKDFTVSNYWKKLKWMY